MRNDTLFHELHKDGLLMLANCWDGGTARIAALAGAKALATSSAAVAWGHGYADGSQLPAALLLETVRDIVRASALPLTVTTPDASERPSKSGFGYRPPAKNANWAIVGGSDAGPSDSSSAMDALLAKVPQ